MSPGEDYDQLGHQEDGSPDDDGSQVDTHLHVGRIPVGGVGLNRDTVIPLRVVKVEAVRGGVVSVAALVERVDHLELLGDENFLTVLSSNTPLLAAIRGYACVVATIEVLD